MADKLPSISRMAVLIPAWHPEPALAALIDALIDAGFGAIVIVDDGSPAASRPLFDKVAAKPGVRLLRHAMNLGKGRALKTGIDYFLNELEGFAGVVTADADGQHAPEDIVRVAEAMLAAPGCAVLGSRSFSGEVPWRSRLGNGLTRVIFSFISGRRVSDTQTGLRAFPAALLPDLLKLKGERYEYEMTVLAYLCRSEHAPVEIPISTIYIEENLSSRFKPVRDSMRIYSVLLRLYCAGSVDEFCRKAQGANEASSRARR